MGIELIYKPSKLWSHDIPIFFDKVEVKAIWPRAFVTSTIPHSFFELKVREGGSHLLSLPLRNSFKRNPIQKRPRIILFRKSGLEIINSCILDCIGLLDPHPINRDTWNSIESSPKIYNSVEIPRIAVPLLQPRYPRFLSQKGFHCI